MLAPESSNPRAGRSRSSRLGIVLLIALAGLLGVGCKTHTVASTNDCYVISKQVTVGTTPGHSGIALAKVGLTPRELKSQQNCHR